jgi:hypothetical protein
MKSTGRESHRWQAVVLGIVVGFFVGVSIAFLDKAPVSLLTSKLLEWPFLAFILVIAFVLVFFNPLEELLARGELTIAWSKDHSIKIRDLSGALDEELDPIRDDIELLKSRLDHLLPRRNIDVNAVVAEEASGSTRADENEQTRIQRLRDALANPKYEWRSVERLAILIGTTEEEVVKLVLSQGDIRLGRGKSGRQIVGLIARVGG